jgi:hypothetical protein
MYCTAVPPRINPRGVTRTGRRKSERHLRREKAGGAMGYISCP